MSTIIVKKEPNIQKEAIEVFLVNPNKDEGKELSSTMDETHEESYASQTAIDGIKCPLIRFNSITLTTDMIRYFKLYESGGLPCCDFEFTDTQNVLVTLENPTSDNKVQIQIIPSFNKIYKKINLTFYAYSIKSYGESIFAKCVYYVDGLNDFKLKSFGRLTTYQLFEMISDETKLGLASNIDETTDERYVYCPCISYKDLLGKEAAVASYDGLCVDYWIDYYDTINIVNLESLYNDTGVLDPIWIANSKTSTDADQSAVKPLRVIPCITNKYSAQGLQTYASEYTTETGSTLHGTDKLYQYYIENNLDTVSLLLQDGDKKENVITAYEYVGEVSGDYDYIAQKMKNEMFRQKINQNIIKVRLDSVCFGLTKGCKVNFEWYVNNDFVKSAMEDSDIETNVSVTPEDPDEIKDKQILDKQITGQYYIMSNDIIYENGKLMQELRLSRPDKDKYSYIK